LTHELENEFNLTVSDEAVRKTLKSFGFVKTLPAKIPYLSQNAIDKRLAYAELHQEERFTNVCFSDESIFQLADNRQLYWWNPNTDDRPVFEDHYNKKKIMIWGGISRKGRTDIYFWKISKDLTVDALEYVKCLDTNLIDRMNTLYGVGNWRFMQDNARVHTAKH
jgi:hypothetical protein